MRTDYCARFGNDRKCFHAFHYALKQILSLKDVSWTPQSFILRGSRAEKLRVYILKSARLSFTYCTIWDKPKTSKKHKKTKQNPKKLQCSVRKKRTPRRNFYLPVQQRLGKAAQRIWWQSSTTITFKERLSQQLYSFQLNNQGLPWWC